MLKFLTCIQSLNVYFVSVYSIYARSQTDTSQGTFDFKTQPSYNITIACNDSKEIVTEQITVYLEKAITTSTMAMTTTVITQTPGSGRYENWMKQILINLVCLYSVMQNKDKTDVFI